MHNQKSSARYFGMVDCETGELVGRYLGQTPKQAASKCYTKMLQKNKNIDTRKIYLEELNTGSDSKIYGYECSRTKLDKPQKLEIPDLSTGQTKIIEYKYRNVIRKIAVDDTIKSMRNDMNVESEEQRPIRHFKMIDPKTGQSMGRYSGQTPRQAASKGFAKLVQNRNIEGEQSQSQNQNSNSEEEQNDQKASPTDNSSDSAEEPRSIRYFKMVDPTTGQHPNRLRQNVSQNLYKEI